MGRLAELVHFIADFRKKQSIVMQYSDSDSEPSSPHLTTQSYRYFPPGSSILWPSCGQEERVCVCVQGSAPHCSAGTASRGMPPSGLPVHPAPLPTSLTNLLSSASPSKGPQKPHVPIICGSLLMVTSSLVAPYFVSYNTTALVSYLNTHIYYL